MPRPQKQATLFDKPQERSLTVVDALAQTRPQDKQQAAFQRLIKQIHELRVQLEEWQTYGLRHNQRVAEKLMPLYAEIRQKRIAMARLLDEQFHGKNAIRGKRLRGKLQRMIVELTRDLIQEEHDEALVALHDRHSDLALEEDGELDKAFSQDIIENIFGVRLDDDETSGNIEEMILKAHQKQARAGEERAAKRAAKKSAKTAAADEKRAAAEEKRAAAEKEVSQSVREVYRKLASALHPDRSGGDLAPERKTELMQRVNMAYDKGNLLELLNIQLEIEQIDADHLANLSAERMAHYIQVLREQHAELKAELDNVLAPYRRLVPFNRKILPVHVDLSIDGEVVRQTNELRHLEADLLSFADPKQLAQALKDYEPDAGFDPFLALGALMDSFGAPPPRPRRRKP
ncbi:MAG: J domain-containing protein [Sulfuritalea sp.]|nr:J domain-containing protein [Sulfuritalea sp.]